MRPPVPPSGQQYEIAAGDHRATIVEVGGGVRAYAAGGHDVLDGYALEEMCEGARGTPLIPWPNRLADGRYEFAGRAHQLALSEPERANAIHGLLRWRSWRALERTPERVVMGVRLHPQPGYPFALDVRIAYSVADTGLEVATTATNIGELECPFGAGQHPYLSSGPDPLDSCGLQLPADTRIVSDERGLPTGREPVDGTEYDFRRERPIGALQIDSAFADLDRETDGRVVVLLRRSDGATAELWADGGYRYIELFTGDTLAPERRRRGLGVEPMSCPPNALASGEDLLRLAPRESFTARWGVRLT